MSLRIQTTQNVLLEFSPASVGDRMVATFIDWFIEYAWAALNWLLFSTFKIKMNIVWGVGMLFIPIWVYPLMMELFCDGQTLGKMAMKIKVSRLDGSAPTLGNYLIRWFVRLIEIFPPTFGVVALVTAAVNGRGQRLGDLLTGTTVIKLQKNLTINELNIVEVPQNHQPVFMEAAQLSDRDVQIIKKVLDKHRKDGNLPLVEKASTKIKEILRIESVDLSDEQLLETILKDHIYLTLQSAE
jgi:uncharacterized RDD family membrane protein YckC